VVVAVVFFFFFQAEDGIRDRNVTGVQTCALPISDAGPGGPALPAAPADSVPHLRQDRAAERLEGVAVPEEGRLLGGDGLDDRLRSEERRVGKECRSRWWP